MVSAKAQDGVKSLYRTAGVDVAAITRVTLSTGDDASC